MAISKLHHENPKSTLSAQFEVKPFLHKQIQCFAKQSLHGFELSIRSSFAIFFLTSFVQGQDLCTSWDEGKPLGELATSIDESSGISSSLQFSERLYHTNDSWNNGAVFFVSDLQGKNVKEIFLEADPKLERTVDIEDMDVGPCSQGSCIFLADIGDNHSKRSEIHLLILPELEAWEMPVSPRVLTLHYPDGPHDAEAFAVHPNGDLYILSKEVFPLKTPPAKLYRLKKELWSEEAEFYTLEFVSSIDLRALSGSSVDVFSHIATGMDISADAQRLLILSYGEVFELQLDLSSLEPNSELPLDLPYKKIEVLTLLQQESISYTAQGYGFIYTAEANPKASPLIQVMCQDSPR